MKSAILIVLGCGLFFLLGLVTGRMTAPDHAVAAPGSVLAQRDTSTSVGDPDLEGPAKTPKEQTKLGFLESLQDDPRVMLAQKLAGWTDDPAGVVGTVIDGMNDDEISMIVSSLTSLNREELENVEDLPRYAKRLAELALNDVSSEPNYYDPELRPIYFSLEPKPDEAVEAQQERFSAGRSRMHAIFPMEGYQRDSVFVKWTRNSDNQVMLFDRYPIRSEEDYNWVYLEPEAGWEKGDYTVSFISDDEEMSLLGTGGFVAE